MDIKDINGIKRDRDNLEYMPNQKWHQIISFIKSGIRIAGYGLLLYSVPIAVGVLILSEAIGIIEKRDVAIAMGIHAGDHAIYPDCRQEFRDADYKAFLEGNWDADLVKYYTPYLKGDKFDILKDGEVLCEELGLEFDEVYSRTNTSYKPIKHYHRPETNAWEWYSDYKSASSVERIEAFIKLGRPDPVAYADETGPVSYEIARASVEKVLSE